MKKIHFNDAAELAEYMFNRVADYEYIAAALFFDDAKELMRELLMHDEVDIGILEISEFDYQGYSDEYYVFLDDEYTLSVEPAMRDDRYMTADPNLLLVHSDAKYGIVQANTRGQVVEVCFDMVAPDDYGSDEDDFEFEIDIDSDIDIEIDEDDLCDCCDEDFAIDVRDLIEFILSSF